MAGPTWLAVVRSLLAEPAEQSASLPRGFWRWLRHAKVFQKTTFRSLPKLDATLPTVLKVVHDQLYQLMVFETPSDHFFQRRGPFRQNFGRQPKKKKITNTKIQDIYHFNLLQNDP